MKSFKRVAPSILSADFANLQRDIEAVAKAGADWLHVDVMDGHFVPNLTIGIPVVASIKKISPLPLDVHLMIENPERYIDGFIGAGASYLTLHIEAIREEVTVVMKRIRDQGCKAGITLRPRTPLSQIEPFLDSVDLVLVMTVEPGFGGQSFMEDQVAKINRLKDLRAERKLNYLIEVDGGINAETARKCHNADVFVAGNYIFAKGSSESQHQRIANLKF